MHNYSKLLHCKKFWLEPIRVVCIRTVTGCLQLVGFVGALVHLSPAPKDDSWCIFIHFNDSRVGVSHGASSVCCRGASYTRNFKLPPHAPRYCSIHCLKHWL